MTRSSLVWTVRVVGSVLFVAAVVQLPAQGQNAAPADGKVQLAQEKAAPEQLPSVPTTVVPGELAPATDQTASTPPQQGPPAQGYSTFGPFAAPGPEGQGRATDLIGISPSASQGTISQADLTYRPLMRTPAFLEAIPGLIAAEQSGGVRMQYFLRGFNLKFGTDFATFVDGAPLNLPSHVHSQGYTDVNFLIPELIKRVDYGKGPYYPEVGDFSAVGFAGISTYTTLPYNFAKLEGGLFDQWRFVVAASPEVGPGVLLYALETRFYDGPWVVPMNLHQLKGMVKYTIADECSGVSLGFNAYNASFTSQEPVPLRAVNSGLISRFGSLDPFDGGIYNRYGLNAQMWQNWEDGSITTANAHATYYGFNEWENETFFLDDPVGGDQVNEQDYRLVSGVNLAHEIPSKWFGVDTKHIVGMQIRQDWIPVNNHIGTSQRQLVDPLINANISQFDGGLYYKNETKWADKLRTMAGFRGDYVNMSVDQQITEANSGNQRSNMFSPKGSLILGPWLDTEVYANAGMSFHSNDAKGVVATVDPGTGDPITPVPALIQARGAEVGTRSLLTPNLNMTVALWYLELDSELLFKGDSGTTEPFPGSHRYGIEVTDYYRAYDWLTCFADYSNSYARFVQFDPAGQFIPNSLETVFSGGFTAKARNGLYTTWNLRYFGPMPLTQDNLIRSGNTTVLNMETGIDRPRYRFAVTILNLYNSKDNDITFFFPSRLPGEPLAGVPDIHFRPLEPFNLRVSMMYKW